MNYEDMTDDITTKTQTTNQLTAEEILAQAFGSASTTTTPASTPTNGTVEATVTTDDDEPYTVSLELTPPEHGRSLLMPNSLPSCCLPIHPEPTARRVAECSYSAHRPLRALVRSAHTATPQTE